MTLPVVSGAVLKTAAIALVGIGFTLAGYTLTAGDTVAARLYTRYVAQLDATYRLLFRPEKGRRVVLDQATAIAAIVVWQGAIGGIPYWGLVLFAVALGPYVVLRRERSQRVAALENQVDGFIVSFANSLKTVPSPAAALQAAVPVLQQPTRQEVEQVLKEMRVGSTLEQALVAMSSRLRSRPLDVAFSAVLIGLRVGGNLPVVLERTAGTIREMNRLLGVLRTKTGEGRSQLWVMALAPVVLVGAFSFVSDGYFDPLMNTLVGQLVAGVAIVLWLASVLLARKILAVDL